MSIAVTPLTDAEPRPRQVAIGTFDGVHVGHRQVIEGSDTVLTFEPHPLSVIHPEAAPKLIMPFEIKRDVIEGLGVSELVVIPFDQEFSRDRGRGVLLADPDRDAGRDGRLGGRELPLRASRRRGTREMLRSHSEFETRVVPLVEVDGETVSSTRIRALVAAGDVEGAMRCLGAPFLLEGEVVEGDKRGRTLGFPTANVVPSEDYAYPGHGVYAAFANGIPAAVNVGVRPTFETGRGVLIESYLIDHDSDLYGQTLRIAFIARLRGEKRFESVDDLVAQMQPRRRAGAGTPLRRVPTAPLTSRVATN